MNVNQTKIQRRSSLICHLGHTLSDGMPSVQVYLGSFHGRRWYLPNTSCYTRFFDKKGWHMPEKVSPILLVNKPSSLILQNTQGRSVNSHGHAKPCDGERTQTEKFPVISRRESRSIVSRDVVGAIAATCMCWIASTWGRHSPEAVSVFSTAPTTQKHHQQPNVCTGMLLLGYTN
jgi:hypothetical protein